MRILFVFSLYIMLFSVLISGSVYSVVSVCFMIFVKVRMGRLILDRV